jgi:dienelactone hydrolase
MLKKFILLFCLWLTSCKAQIFERFERINEDVPIKVVHSRTKENFGTVLLMHGCAGENPHNAHWGEQYARQGFNAVLIDSWLYHNVPWMYACKNFVDPRIRLKELYITANWVRKQPWHKGGVFLAGYSHGGVAAVQASKRPVSDGIDKIVAYYPYCLKSDHTVPPQVPIQVHIGTADDWTPAERCRGMYDNVEIGEYFEYEGAYHNFDNPGQDSKVLANGTGGSLAWKTVRYNPEASDLAFKRVLEFFKR